MRRVTDLFGFAVLAEQLGAAEAARVGQRRGRAARPAQPARACRRRLAPHLLLIFTHPPTYATHEKSQPPRYRCFMRAPGIVFDYKTTDALR